MDDFEDKLAQLAVKTRVLTAICIDRRFISIYSSATNGKPKFCHFGTYNSDCNCNYLKYFGHIAKKAFNTVSSKSRLRQI